MMEVIMLQNNISKLAGLQNAARASPLESHVINAATLTDLCNTDDLAEVEIISLLKETIPKYRLRADSITEFEGYNNQDWFIPSPASKQPTTKLSPDQIRETFNYFLLCSDRVSQMTKTYHDIEAVTRLLEEKEKDLELTARIGKELLITNEQLEIRVNTLEGELCQARECITQLRHELAAKSDLLQVLTDDTEDDKSESGLTSETLLHRTSALERENKALREEATRLAAGTDDAEEQEQQLLYDIAQQLSTANSEANMLSRELAAERDRNADLKTELTATAERLQITERKLAQISAEYEHTLQVLEITKGNQNALAMELADAKERYAEVLALLHECQEALRREGRGGRETRRGVRPPQPPPALMPHVAIAAGLSSLHSELHSSVYSDISLDSGIVDYERPYRTNSSVQKIFDTVACVPTWSTSICSSDRSEAGTSSTHSSLLMANEDVFDVSSDEDVIDSLYPGGTGGAGVPGAPGAAELAAALKRLSPSDIQARRSRMRTYDSGESAVWGVGERWRPPNKLQIVKPLEGSYTLHTWARLAKPHLAGVLEQQEGIGVRGGRYIQDGYSLSDLEEDDELQRFPLSSHVFTLTNSTVLHPGSSCASTASSVLGSEWSSRRSSRLTSRRSSCSTSPSRRDSVPRRISPTATPANSPLLGSPPDASPPSTPPPPTLPPGRAPGSLYTTHGSPMEQLTRLQRVRRPRTDLGTVRPDLGTVALPTQKAQPAQPQQERPVHMSALGTLSSLLFGRKGGLL